MSPAEIVYVASVPGFEQYGLPVGSRGWFITTPRTKTEPGLPVAGPFGSRTAAVQAMDALTTTRRTP